MRHSRMLRDIVDGRGSLKPVFQAQLMYHFEDSCVTDRTFVRKLKLAGCRKLRQHRPQNAEPEILSSALCLGQKDLRTAFEKLRSNRRSGELVNVG